MQSLLIDTSAIFAFVTRSDKEHGAAVAFTRAWVAQGRHFVLPDVVFNESMTLLKARVGADIAIKTGQVLRTNPAYRWTTLGVEPEAETWTIFQRYRDKAWSFTDCALLALARQTSISSVFSYDRHFDQMRGMTRVGD